MLGDLEGALLPASPVVEVSVDPLIDGNTNVKLPSARYPQISGALGELVGMPDLGAELGALTGYYNPVAGIEAALAELATANRAALDVLLDQPSRHSAPPPVTAVGFAGQTAVDPPTSSAAIGERLRKAIAVADEELAAAVRVLEARATSDNNGAGVIDESQLLVQKAALRLEDERRRATRLLRGLKNPERLSGWAWREDVELWFVDRTAAHQQPDPWWRVYLLIPDPLLAGVAGQRAVSAVADAFGTVRFSGEGSSARRMPPFAAIVVPVRSVPAGVETVLGPKSPSFLATRYDALFARRLLARLQRVGSSALTREGHGLEGVYLALTASDLMIALASDPAVPLPRTELVEITSLDAEQMRCALYLLRRDLLAAASIPRRPTIAAAAPTRLTRAEPGPMRVVADAIGKAFLVLAGTARAGAAEAEQARFVEPEVRRLCEQAGLEFAQAH